MSRLHPSLHPKTYQGVLHKRCKLPTKLVPTKLVKLGSRILVAELLRQGETVFLTGVVLSTVCAGVSSTTYLVLDDVEHCKDWTGSHELAVLVGYGLRVRNVPSK